MGGYSRKILWLQPIRSNNKPEISAKFYLECVKEHSGCPTIIRTDCGTENGTVATIQAYFRPHGNDQFAGSRSHIYRTSPDNQRIEAWWSYYKRGRSSWWFDFFKDMSATGVLNVVSEFHLECLWLCFQSVLQDDQVKNHRNTHRKRRSKYGTVPGVPHVLLYLPHRLGAVDCKVHVTEEQTDVMEVHTQIHDTDNEDTIIYQEYFIMSWTVKNYLSKQLYWSIWSLWIFNCSRSISLMLLGQTTFRISSMPRCLLVRNYGSC